MTHGSLFSGIGGFDIAAEWMGWENVFHCEWNPFGQKVLKYYWPDAISYNDITKTDFTIHRGRIDILTGGFPCQPYSMAGKRLGKEDDRHLWPEMLRAIREIQPRWVVGENVFGLVNWSGGLVFHEVQADLEAEGYEVQPFVLPAVSVNAPHRRDRVWFVARYAASNGETQKREVFGERQRGEKSTDTFGTCADATQNTIRDGCLRGEPIEEGAEVWQQRDISTGDTERVRGAEMAGITAHTISNGRQKHSGSMEFKSRTEKGGGHKFTIRLNDNGTDGDAADTYGIRLEHGKEQGEVGDRSAEIRGTRSEPANAIETNGEVRHAADTNTKRLQCERRSAGMGRKRFGINNSQNNRPTWENFPTVSAICDGNDGISDRLDGITFSKWRQESIKAGGNAVVPQVVLQIFRTIEEYEKMNTQ